MVLRVIFVCCISLLALSFSEGGVVAGYIHDTNKAPIEGAVVFIHELHKATNTNERGYFLLNTNKTGRYHLHIEMIGYEAVSQDIDIQNDTLYINFVLKESIHQLDEVVIESGALKQGMRETSLSSEQITEEYIQDNVSTTLSQSLEKLPGVSTLNMGNSVSKPVIRGMSFNRVLVSDNGIKQEGQQWGADHGLEIDPFSVEQLEIIKGPSSLQYGSDAMAGVMAIRSSRSPSVGTHKAGSNLFYRSNNDTYGLNIRAKGNEKGYVYRVSATMLEYGDYKVPANSFSYNRYVLPIENKRLKNTAGNEKHALLMLGMNRNWGYSHITVSRFEQKVGVFSGAMGIPRAYQLTNDGNDRNIDMPQQQITHHKLISNSNIRFGKHWLELDLGYQYNLRKELSRPHAHGQPVDVTNNEAIRLGLSTTTINSRLHLKTDSIHSSVIGIQGQYTKNRQGGYEFLIPEYTQQQLGAFALHQWNVSSKLVLNGGIRLDFTKLRAPETTFPFYYQRKLVDTIQRNPTIDRTFTNFSGSIGLAYVLSSKWQFKFNLGKSFRTPTVPELTSNGTHHGSFRFEKGSANLTSESGFQSDIGIYYERKKWELSVTPFFNYFNNYIYLRPTGIFATEKIQGIIYPFPNAENVYQYTQANSIHTGGESVIQLHTFHWWDIHISTEYVYAQNIELSQALPFIPPLTTVLENEWTWKWNQHRIRSIKLTHSISMYSSQNRTDINELSTKGYTLMNAGAHVLFGKKKERVKISYQLFNMMNTRYLNHLSRYRLLNLPEPGRNSVITISFMLE